MEAFAFYVTVPVLWLISLLPFWALYRVSDAVRGVLFHLFRYRRGVIQANLRAAFPDWSEPQRAELERAFYRHMIDLFFETFKGLSASQATIQKRCVIAPETISTARAYKTRNQDVIGVMGHFGNWEWGGAAFDSRRLGLGMAVLYSPLHNRRFEHLIYRMRTRHGLELIPARGAKRIIPTLLGSGRVFTFIADQSAHPAHAYWTTFLNQDTAVFRGAEHFAREYNLPVAYISIHKPRRGHYTLTAEILVEHPRECAPDAITEMVTRRLERDILSQPEIWLWSHRRWKHQRRTGGPVRR